MKIIRLALMWSCLRLLLATLPVASQTQSAGQTPNEILRNETIIELVKFGFGEDVIVEKIRQSEHEFDTSLEGLKKLKEAGVSDAVIKAMVSAQPASAKAEASAPPTDPDDPMSPHEPGIYCLTSRQGKVRLLQIEPTVYSQGKSEGWLGTSLTYGLAKTKVKAVVSRPRARMRLAQPRPAFYFYFEEKSSGLSYPNSFIAGATSPNEFVLVKMKEKDDRRELTVAEANAFSSSSGTRSEDTRDFDFEKIRPGVYKVVVTTPLELGEYCFFYAGSATAIAAGARLFDFGIDLGREEPPSPRMEETTVQQQDEHLKSADKAVLIKAQIAEMKGQHFIVNLGQSGLLRKGMSVQIFHSARGDNLGSAFGAAAVLEVSANYAILKMDDAANVKTLAVGDKIALKDAQLAASE